MASLTMAGEVHNAGRSDSMRDLPFSSPGLSQIKFASPLLLLLLLLIPREVPGTPEFPPPPAVEAKNIFGCSWSQSRNSLLSHSQLRGFSKRNKNSKQQSHFRASKQNAIPKASQNFSFPPFYPLSLTSHVTLLLSTLRRVAEKTCAECKKK